MAVVRHGAVLQSLRTLFEVGAIGGLSDGQLLERFLDRRDEHAFAALVHRHGPMVLEICHQALGDPHDAQDAFQATFLVLASRAVSIRRRDSLASWLFGVAHRVAVRARVEAARRQAHERRAARREAIEGPLGWDRDDYQALHEEIARLPEKYREPVVLCDLEGMTQAAAAERLRCPVGTVGVRLMRARERLRSRLARSGLAAPAGLSPRVSEAAVRSVLVDATVRAAMDIKGGMATGAISAFIASLVRDTVRGMVLTRITIAAAGAILAIVVSVGGHRRTGAVQVGSGVGIFAHSSTTGAKQSPPATAARPSAAAGNPSVAKPTTSPPTPKPVTPEPTGAGGTVVAVDPAGWTVTVARKTSGGPVQEVVPLTADTRVLVDGEAAGLPDTPVGAVAAFVLSSDDGRPRTVAAMRVTGPTVHGRVAAVSDVAITLDLGGKGVKPPPREYCLAPAARARVAKDGRVIPLDVRAGETATVVLTADQSTAVAVFVARGASPKKGESGPATTEAPHHAGD